MVHGMERMDNVEYARKYNLYQQNAYNAAQQQNYNNASDPNIIDAEWEEVDTIKLIESES